jgi:hypothetical protein
MSELQAGESGITFDSPAIEESSQPGKAELVSASDDLAASRPVEGEQNTDSDNGGDPDGYTRAINKQHRKFRDEERRANDLERQLSELKAKQAPTPQGATDVPELPDSWDDNYDQKMRDRDDAIRQNANAAAMQSHQAEALAKQDQERQREQIRKTQDLQDGFSSNAKKLGIDEGKLQTAQDTVVEYGVTPDIATAILKDNDGPLILQYLAANPLDLYDLTNGNQFQAGQKWGEIKAKSAALKPSKTSAPAPATAVSGSGSPPRERGPKGATFE